MYSRNFGTGRSTPPPPPSYSGVMYPREELPDAPVCEADVAEEQEVCSQPPEVPCTEAAEDKDKSEKKGLLGSLFGRTLTFEDLLLVGLIIMLADSGADDELLIILAFLLIAGR